MRVQDIFSIKLYLNILLEIPIMTFEAVLSISFSVITKPKYAQVVLIS